MNQWKVRAVLLFAVASISSASVLGSLRGIVHDPDHRPVANARVLVKAVSSDYTQTLTSGTDGAFETITLPPGQYRVTVSHDGFQTAEQEVVLSSREAPILHFQLEVGTTSQVVNVEDRSLTVSPDSQRPRPSSAGKRFAIPPARI